MSQQPRILYVDDEADLLEIAASFFEEEGLPIDTCSDMQQAISMIKESSYDVIISDAKMPTGSGYDLMNIVKNEGYFRGKSILVTGNIPSVQDNAEHVFDQVCLKPLQFDELIDAVKKLLSL